MYNANTRPVDNKRPTGLIHRRNMKAQELDIGQIVTFKNSTWYEFEVLHIDDDWVIFEQTSKSDGRFVGYEIHKVLKSKISWHKSPTTAQRVYDLTGVGLNDFEPIEEPK